MILFGKETSAYESGEDLEIFVLKMLALETALAISSCYYTVPSAIR